MNTLADLHRAVQKAVAGKRLGTPVFVRYLLQGRDPPEAILPRLAQAAQVVREWLGQQLDRVHAAGTVDSGQVAVTLLFRGGATALVSYARGTAAGPGVDLLVLGNHGVLTHDVGGADLWEAPEPVPRPQPDPPLLHLIDRALRSGKPTPAEPEGQP